MKWSCFKLKPFVDLSNKNLSNWYELAFFCAFHEQSLFASTRANAFRQFTATDARFSFRKFSRIKRQIWGKNFTTFLSSLYRFSDLTMRVVIFRSVCHPSRGLEKKSLLTTDAKKCEGQINCVQLWKTLCNQFQICRVLLEYIMVVKQQWIINWS